MSSHQRPLTFILWFHGFEFSINKGTNWHRVSSLGTNFKIKMLWQRTGQQDKCPASRGAQAVQDRALKLVLERVKMSKKQTIYNFFLRMTKTTKFLIYFFKIKAMQGSSFLIKIVPFSWKYTVLRFRTYHKLMALPCFS